jgi:hypothetical protein
MNEQLVARVLAWLLRNESVTPDAIERAVSSAVDMRPAETPTLDGDHPLLRRAFVNEQVARLECR